MKSQQFKFVEDVHVDRDGSTRVRVRKGDTFTAVLDDEMTLPRPNRFDPNPVAVPTGRKFVVSADIAVLTGCLTSCIRTGRAIPVGPSRDA